MRNLSKAASIYTLYYLGWRGQGCTTGAPRGKEAQAAVGDDAELLDVGKRYLERQIVSLGSGSTEIARNVVAERVSNFPREYAADRGVPVSQVRRRARLMS